MPKSTLQLVVLCSLTSIGLTNAFTQSTVTSAVSQSALQASIPSWEKLSSMPNFSYEQPYAINGNSSSSKPSIRDGKPILYRERHGWCPYSERVWFAFEVKKVDYDTVYIDNIYGRPSWYGGNTPQVMWGDGYKIQSESMDLVREVDKRFEVIELYPDDILNEVINKARAFDNIFPRGARPSSRAAFLFRYDGEPLWKNEFEKVLRETDELLGSNEGPFFCGDRFTAADIAWAPFLERYAGQLPVLHYGLNPKCAETYPYLARWYEAMEQQIPEYGCRIRGDSSSWRKVLTMAGFGNAGNVPSLVNSRMKEESEREKNPLTEEEKVIQTAIWGNYSADRPYVAETASKEAASVLIRNRDMIVKDIEKRRDMKTNTYDLPVGQELDESLRCLASILCEDEFESSLAECRQNAHVAEIAAFLDKRMCVPRDMGALSAAYFKRVQHKI